MGTVVFVIIILAIIGWIGEKINQRRTFRNGDPELEEELVEESIKNEQRNRREGVGYSLIERTMLDEIPFFQENPELYKEMTLEQTLKQMVSECDFHKEIFNCLVFYTVPEINKKQERIDSFLEAGGYHKQAGSAPILFVDGSLLHTRSHGFVVASDGIYTPKGFMPYSTTFAFGQSGIQELSAYTFKGSYGGPLQKVMKMDCPVGKDALDDISLLVMVIYIYSYYHN